MMNKRISLFILIILTLSLFGSSPKPVHAQTWWNTGWNYRIIIEIDHTKIEATLYDFPVLVYLNDTKIDWTHVQDDLDDLRFIDTDEITQLYAELENYTVNNEAWIWVKIPTVYYMEAGINQEFYLYYGNNAVSSWWNPEDVWEDSAVMVQHMTDNPDNAHITDSTQYDNDGTKKGADEPIETASGKIDDAQDFDGNNDYIGLGNPASLDFTTGDLSIDCWIYCTTDRHQVLVMRGDWNNGYYYAIGGAYKIYLELNDGTERKYTWDVDYLLNAWHHLIVVANRTSDLAELFIDGISKGIKDISATTGSITSSNNYMGSYQGWAFFYENIIDEVRIYNVAQSAEWIKADYNSGADTLLIYEAEELCPLALTILYNTGINKLYINGTERANNTTIYVDKNVNVNATVTVKPNFIFMKYALGSTGASLIPTYIFNMTNPFTLWSYATPNFYIYEEPTTFTFTHWIILLFIALVISLLAAIKFHIIAIVSLILVLYMVINVASYTGIILLAIIVWLLTIMFSIIAFGEI